MPVTVKELTINTKVNKKDDKAATPEAVSSGELSQFQKELIIQECLGRVKEMLEYELKP